jgi:hypothetical protein
MLQRERAWTFTILFNSIETRSSFMAVQLEQRNDGKFLVARVTGRLETQDYERFIPEVEQLTRQHGTIRLLLETHDFNGWKAGPLWEDLSLDLKPLNNIERLAVVGDEIWEKSMVLFSRPFKAAAVRFFPHDKANDAWNWVEGE